MRKAILIVWFGPWPAWGERYFSQMPAPGFDRIVFNDLEEFRRRVKRDLGIACPIQSGDAKIHDYRAAFGRLFAPELAGYRWWAHTDLDCVYGRLGRFYGPGALDDYDVVSDHTHYICGPWTIYRNTDEIADLFRNHPDWREIMAMPDVAGWVETGFTQLMNESGLRVDYRLHHAWGSPDDLSWQQNGRLYENEREVSFFHFRRTKVWPEIATGERR